MGGLSGCKEGPVTGNKDTCVFKKLSVKNFSAKVQRFSSAKRLERVTSSGVGLCSREVRASTEYADWKGGYALRLIPRAAHLASQLSWI